jgi:predicted Zn-dependent protease
MAYKSMDLGGPEVHDPVIVTAIQRIVDRLAPHAAIDGLEFDIHVIESPMVNAFCLPGGTIVVYTGLIAEAGDAEQVAGVIAHEIAHATLRHGMERVSQSLGLTAAVQLILGDVAGLGAAGAELFKFATINSYSRDQEAAADAEGARMLYAAKIDPTALARFFETLKNQEGDLPGVVSWISTHPQHDERIAAVEAQADALAPQAFEPLDIDWHEVQEHVGRD